MARMSPVSLAGAAALAALAVPGCGRKGTAELLQPPKLAAATTVGTAPTLPALHTVDHFALDDQVRGAKLLGEGRDEAQPLVADAPKMAGRQSAMQDLLDGLNAAKITALRTNPSTRISVIPNQAGFEVLLRSTGPGGAVVVLSCLKKDAAKMDLDGFKTAVEQARKIGMIPAALLQVDGKFPDGLINRRGEWIVYANLTGLDYSPGNLMPMDIEANRRFLRPAMNGRSRAPNALKGHTSKQGPGQVRVPHQGRR